MPQDYAQQMAEEELAEPANPGWNGLRTRFWEGMQGQDYDLQKVVDEARQRKLREMIPLVPIEGGQQEDPYFKPLHIWGGDLPPDGRQELDLLLEELKWARPERQQAEWPRIG